MTTQSTSRKIKRKCIKVVEIEGAGKYDLERGQQVISSRTMHRVGGDAQKALYPQYKTVLVISCVEFEDE